jgi:hypothetical protein
MKRINPGRIKINRSYTIVEVARVLRVHKRTVQRWIGRGLPTCDDARPTLLLGGVLRDFLRQQQLASKQPCQPGQLHCVCCRAPKSPAGQMVDFIPTTPTSGYLRGICPDCGTLIHRGLNTVALKHVASGLEVAFPRAQLRLSDTSRTLENVAVGWEVTNHAEA